jgi:murein DD-endopeptidase MepM/ murein hydrolase activator NlpD
VGCIAARAVPRVASALWASLVLASAQPFQPPTANRALLETGGEARFFVGTIGKPWMSGTFGCVRTEGRQMHEGLDIRCLQRDRRGEPIDPVLATADGTVAYVNSKSGLSNYGLYVILRHDVEGMEIYSLYAHLREIRRGLQVGQTVKAGERIATLGRTANTREAISRERAHVHFELNLVLNDRFAEWYRKTFPGQRNDHGNWNGQNLVGLDPWALFRAQQEQGGRFSLRAFIRDQAELCRVLVRDTHFPWLRRYYPLIRRNPVAEQQGVAGYEIRLNYVGVPFTLTPRAASEIPGKARVQLLSVNAEEQRRHPCRKLVALKNGRWELASSGAHLLDLLTY